MRNPLRNPMMNQERELYVINRQGVYGVRRVGKKPLMLRALHMIFPDQRRHRRIAMPPIVAFIGISSKRYVVGDISNSGLFLVTEDRWMPGSPMPLSLVRTDSGDVEEFVTVEACVVRNAEDGVGFKFLLADDEGEVDDAGLPGARWASALEMMRFVAGLERSTVEMGSAAN
ncbi:PilZ domain-containing protein [Occallatibacter savannae]|uniref:PilZ domain-containing protein n=1 Tax=Occallatibacter savannae TaxID=1002691 RepID=UPI000D69D1AE|nr:PilZ domain-containing protein [Occallatibacter savannae]